MKIHEELAPTIIRSYLRIDITKVIERYGHILGVSGDVHHPTFLAPYVRRKMVSREM